MDNVRNVSIVGHNGCGKTTLSEALLFNAGLTKRLGRVEDGTTVTDYSSDEIKRQMTIDSSLIFSDWRDKRIYMVDTPGYADFSCDVRYSMRAFDGAIVVVDATSGIQVGTETAWEYADEFGLPRVIFVTMMDKESADFDSVLQELTGRWGKSYKIVPVQLPLGKQAGFSGIIDILEEKVISYKDGNEKIEDQIPAEFSEKVSPERSKLAEIAAENDDALIEKYLEEGSLGIDDMRKGLRIGVLQKKIVPVLCGSGYLNIAVRPLYDAIVDYMPSPLERAPLGAASSGTEDEKNLEFSPDGPFVGYVFKVVHEPHLGNVSFFRVFSGKLNAGTEIYNSTRNATERVNQVYLVRGRDREETGEAQAGHIVACAKLKVTRTGDTLSRRENPVVLKALDFPEGVASIALNPKTKKDQEKLSICLGKLAAEDPALKIRLDHEFGQTLLTGMGDIQLDIVVERLKERFGVEVSTEKTKVAYREAIRSRAQAQGKYKRQSGGRGQYGDVWLELEALPRDKEFEFVDKIVGGAIPNKYIPAVEKGVREAMSKGILAGYPVTNVRTTLCDGTFHNVDSSDMAFQIAASMAFKSAFMKASPVLLEPYVELGIVVPDEFVGDVTSDLNSKRGRVIGIEPKGERKLIKAHVPLSELERYSTDLKSMTRGRGSYQMNFSHYEEMPSRLAEKLISSREE